MFSRLSIRAKIIAVISFLFVAMIFVSVFAFTELRAISESTHEIQANWMPSVRWLSELRIQSARYRAILRDHLLISDAKAKANIDKALDDRVKEYDLATVKYRELISSQEEQVLFNELTKLWQAYRNAANEVIELSKKGDLAQAVDTNTNKATPP